MSIIATNQVSPFSRVLNFLDWIPAISSVKAAVDFYFQNFAFPSTFTGLSFYSKEYFKHLSEKESWRYVCVVPYAGNVVAASMDIVTFASAQAQIISMGSRTRRTDDAEIERDLTQNLNRFRASPAAVRSQAIEDAFRSAVSGYGSKQKASWKFLFKVIDGTDVTEKNKVNAWFQANLGNFTSYDLSALYKTSGTPASLKSKIYDFYIEKTLAGSYTEKYELVKILKNVDQAEKGRIIGALQRAAESGNKKGYDFLISDFVCYNKARDAQTTGSIFQWLVHLARTPSSSCHQYAWDSLQTMFYVYPALKNNAFESYLELAQTPVQTPQIRQKIKRFFLITCNSANASEKAQVKALLLRLAQTGSADQQYLAGKFLLRENDINGAVATLERAAATDHLKAIIQLGNIYYSKKQDIDRAIYWFEKAAPRDSRVQRLLDRLKAQKESARQRQERNQHYQQQSEEFRRAREEYNNFFRNFNPGRSGQRAQQERAHAEEAQRKRKNDELAEATNKLEQILGAKFSNLAQLTGAYRQWSLRGGHPDKGGSTERFQEMANLMERVKELNGWN